MSELNFIPVKGTRDAINNQAFLDGAFYIATDTSEMFMDTLNDQGAEARLSLNSNIYITPQKFGAKADGKTDDTAAIQAAFDSLTDGGTIYFPPGEYIIRHCLRDPDDTQDYIAILVKGISNLTILFDNAALIKHELADVDRYTLFRFNGIVGLEISGGIIEADRDEHADVASGYGSKGIHILNCNNVYIHDMEVRNIFGDCIGVQGTSGKSGSNNVLIENCTLHNCYRNGVTIGGVQNGIVRNCHIYEVRGGNPQAGIDIEAEYGYDNNDITIEGCHIHDCGQNTIINSSQSFDILIKNNLLVGTVSTDVLADRVSYYNTIITGGLRIQNSCEIRNCEIKSVVGYINECYKRIRELSDGTLRIWGNQTDKAKIAEAKANGKVVEEEEALNLTEDELRAYTLVHCVRNPNIKMFDTVIKGSLSSPSVSLQTHHDGLSLGQTSTMSLYCKGCEFTHLNGSTNSLFYNYGFLRNYLTIEDSIIHIYNNSKSNVDTFQYDGSAARWKEINLIRCRFITEEETISQRIIRIGPHKFSLIDCIFDMSKTLAKSTDESGNSIGYQQQSIVALYNGVTANCHGNKFISSTEVSLCNNVFGTSNVSGIAYVTNNSAPTWSGIASASTKDGTVYVQGNVYANSPAIPTKISELIDDVGYLTEESDPTISEWAKAKHKPTYTAEEIGADLIGTAATAVSTHNASNESHNDIRLSLQQLAQKLNTLADSDDTTLDQLSEIVQYIKTNKSLIEAITTAKVNYTDIIDNLATNVNNKPLSAAQGVALKNLFNNTKEITVIYDDGTTEVMRVVVS